MHAHTSEQCTFRESIGADRLNRIRENNRLKPRACKEPARNPRHSFAKRHAGDGVAAIEYSGRRCIRGARRSKRRRQHDVVQRSVVFKCTRINLRNCRRNCQRFERGTSRKRITANCCKSFVELQSAQRCACLESIVSNALGALRNHNVLHARATSKRIILNCSNALGQTDRFQRGTIVEAIGSQCHQAVRKHNLLKGNASIESIFAD